MNSGLINAKDVVVSKRNSLGYVSSRISDAAARGYNSTRVYIDNKELDEVILLLRNSDYSVEILEVMPNRTTNIEVGW
jgi:hypothetical protein